MKRFFVCLTIFFAVLSLAVLSSCNDETGKKRKFINIGTASISGVYYPTGVALCRMVNKTYEDIQCSVQSTPGSIYNINALRNGDLDIGIAQADSEYNAYNGIGIFEKRSPMKNLRTVFLIHHDVFTVIARKDSKIATLNDLKGKRVNIGSPGTGVRDTVKAIMDIKHWHTSDFKLAAELKSSEQAQALCDNKIDVMIDVIGHPNGSVQEASATCETVMISIDKETIEKLQEIYPYYDNYTIPGGMYIGNLTNIDTFAIRTSLLSTNKVENYIIYDVVKSTFEHLNQFKATHPLFAKLTKENMVNKNTAPIHDGAAKYFKEIGLM